MEGVFHIMLLSEMLGILVVLPGEKVMNVFVKNAVGLVCPFLWTGGVESIG
jgi:hypothetical protein